MAWPAWPQGRGELGLFPSACPRRSARVVGLDPAGAPGRGPRPEHGGPRGSSLRPSRRGPLHHRRRAARRRPGMGYVSEKGKPNPWQASRPSRLRRRPATPAAWSAELPARVQNIPFQQPPPARDKARISEAMVQGPPAARQPSSNDENRRGRATQRASPDRAFSTGLKKVVPQHFGPVSAQ